eukprot:CAMPEP_0197846604 /NCGR_PEP_ID=MMETSP1438-20131217/3706_1 /TAXON_ID=1461541 /ORGANISM="Pterosperma sp., Strain CCMP1384" /LENGTH=373 /DNA_ID=CAMNT_0043458309 /DNA_START=315 /DNA_END=1433 /DNA_ORIENTATION=+
MVAAAGAPLDHIFESPGVPKKFPSYQALNNFTTAWKKRLDLFKTKETAPVHSYINHRLKAIGEDALPSHADKEDGIEAWERIHPDTSYTYIFELVYIFHMDEDEALSMEYGESEHTLAHLQHQLPEKDQPYKFAGNITPDVSKNSIDLTMLPDDIDITKIGGVKPTFTIGDEQLPSDDGMPEDISPVKIGSKSTTSTKSRVGLKKYTISDIDTTSQPGASESISPTPTPSKIKGKGKVAAPVTPSPAKRVHFPLDKTSPSRKRTIDYSDSDEEDIKVECSQRIKVETPKPSRKRVNVFIDDECEEAPEEGSQGEDSDPNDDAVELDAQPCMHCGIAEELDGKKNTFLVCDCDTCFNVSHVKCAGYSRVPKKEW